MSRLSGALIIIVALVATGLFTWGLVIGPPWNFWAIAIPIIGAVALVLLLALWIGWTLLTEPGEAPAPTPAPPEKPKA